MLPAIDGFETCRRLREADVRAPVLTAKELQVLATFKSIDTLRGARYRLRADGGVPWARS